MGEKIARTSVPGSAKRAAYALNLAEENGEGDMYYCDHGQMSSTTAIQDECDADCVGGE
jgi:hypothetical protein